MAHVTLHLTIGMLLGCALAARRLRAAWRRNERLARPVARALLLAYGLGALAVVPSLLRRAGLPDAVCDGPWMSVFVFYPAVKRVFRYGGMPLGAAALTAAFAAQYAFILLAIARQRRSCARPDRGTSSPSGPSRPAG